MNEKHIDQILEKTHLEHLRTRILLLLDESYPDRLHSDMVWYRLRHEKHYDTGLNDFLREMHYLEEKQLLRVEEILKERFLVAITAKGRDFVSGHLQEAGLADPSLCK